MDGGSRGEVEIESFSANAVTVIFHGFNTHPGYAHKRMINAIKIAADFIHLLPRESLSPETTADYEGFVHPYIVKAGVDRTSVKLIVRDFETTALKTKEELIEQLALQAVSGYLGARVEFLVEEQYRNMREILERHPDVAEYARDAVRRAGVTVRERPIRGGTDGSRLSFMGLPTPNIFAGEHNFHSRLEWVSAEDMAKAVEVIVHLCRIWEERS
jgi:tripeptide aminopeptidase